MVYNLELLLNKECLGKDLACFRALLARTISVGDTVEFFVGRGVYTMKINRNASSFFFKNFGYLGYQENDYGRGFKLVIQKGFTERLPLLKLLTLSRMLFEYPQNYALETYFDYLGVTTKFDYNVLMAAMTHKEARYFPHNNHSFITQYYISKEKTIKEMENLAKEQKDVTVKKWLYQDSKQAKLNANLAFPEYYKQYMKQYESLYS